MKKKSFAKVNVFLKISAKRNTYHELVSRFVKVTTLYDDIEFESTKVQTFTLTGSFSCPLESNTIYKAYLLLSQISPNVEKYFLQHSIKVTKRIPEFAGLGGGSSNCATFMLMVNEVCLLNLSIKELIDLGVQIGADVPFFLSGFNSANITGIGEIVEEFNEDILNIEIKTPDIKCNTKKIFSIFREKFYKEISNTQANYLLKKKSLDIIKEYNIFEANDLYEVCLYEYKELKKFQLKSWFFSGSGSSFFKVIQ